MPEVTKSEWDRLVEQTPESHILETSTWGELKSAFGWRAVQVIRGQCGAQILFRRLPVGFSMAYIPRGPVGPVAGWENLWSDIDLICRRERAILLLVEPNLFEGDSGNHSTNLPSGFSPAIQSIQPRRTIIIDLRGEEADILARMKQKTRYNIRLAQKRGIQILSSQDLEMFHQLMMETGDRDEFGVHSLEYYQRAYNLFFPLGKCELLFAFYDEQPLAALMVFSHGKTAWYFYGASSDHYREYMPTYLLQFEAMRWARTQGCLYYDLWGVPDVDEADLEENFIQRKDGLWGVYRFKRGFGGELRRAVAPWQRVYQPILYPFYRWWVQRRQVD